MATKKTQAGEVEGLALVDIHHIGAKCGEWISIPADLAKALQDNGEFDPKAPRPIEE